MNNIGVCTNKDKDKGFIVTNEIMQTISDLGAKAEIAKFPNIYDAIISVGGDGTFLGTARRIIDKNIPVVGVNVGNLGYLSSIEKSEIKTAMKQLIDDEYRIEERAVLEANNEENTLYAINDIVVSRGNYEKMINIRIMLDNRYFDDYYCDGIIISTPTGSTAYSLSAGGPIVEPEIEALLITPVCAHSLHQRPVIISQDRKVEIISNDEHSFMVSADGQESIEDKRQVLIKKSVSKIKVIRLKDEFFFDTVREKLMLKSSYKTL